jgi:N-acetylneuraminate synthase
MIFEQVDRCYIIAEAGVNHNGSLELAHQLIDVAANVGVDAIKFQTFRAERLVMRDTPKAYYQVENTGNNESQFSMLKALELDVTAHQELFSHCQERQIEFLSTPFDIESLYFLVNELGISRLKIGSGDLTNALLLLTAAKTKLPIILSTGMSLLGEVESALSILAYGYTQDGSIKPSRDAFESVYASSVGQTALAKKVTLLHCTTEYPTQFEQVNLRVMDTLSQAFGLPSGLSDHTMGISAAVAAVARGARIIEKHFTLDQHLPGPDHCASLNPLELEALVKSVREVELVLGKSVKYPVAAEICNKSIARRGLVAACPIQRGEVFSQMNLDVKRGGVVGALNYWDWIGRVAERDYAIDEAIDLP